MSIDEVIKDEKYQYHNNRESAKKYQHYHQVKLINKYLTDEDILSSSQRRLIRQAKFTCSPLGKMFAKQVKTIEEQGNKIKVSNL